MDCSMPGFHVLHYLLEFAQTHVHRVSDATQPSRPLSPLSLPAFNLSQQQGLFQWLFRTNFLKDWLVGSPCSPRDSQESSPTPQFKSINSSALSFLQLSYPYMTTGKTIALTWWIFVGKVVSLFFNILSRLFIAFLPSSKHLLISWPQSPSAVILEPQENKVCHCFPCFPICLPWSGGTGCLECWVLSQLLNSPLSLSSRGSLVLWFLP